MTSVPEFHISLSRPRAGAVVVAVGGEVDLCSSTTLREKLKESLAEGPELLVIDLAQVSFIDSTGLSCLVSAAHRTTNVDCALAVVAPAGRVRQLIAMTGIDRVITVHETLADALAQSPERGSSLGRDLPPGSEGEKALHHRPLRGLQ
jgi:anti-sigma B factor antagonist